MDGARTQQPSADLVIAGGAVLLATGEVAPRNIEICSGRVASLHPHRAERPDGVPTVDAHGLVVLPGLVNAHTHSYAQLARSPFADSWLEPWMPRAMAAWRGAGPEAFGLAAALTAADALRRGITTVVDHATLDPASLAAVVDSYDRSGLRVLLALQVTDLPFADWVPGRLSDTHLAARLAAADPFVLRDADQQLALVEAAADQLADHPRISVLVGPAAPERCSDRLLAGLASLAERHRLPVHTHLLEVPSQRVWGDVLGRLDDHGLLGATTTVAHAVHLDERDVTRLSAAEAGVVLNPISNEMLGCRTTAPATALRTAGADIGVGTDGCNCGGGQDLLASARAAMTMERHRTDPSDWLGPRMAWELATTGLARPLGQPALGRIEVGAPADLLLVDPDAAGWLDLADPAGEALLRGFGTGLRSVFVAGATPPGGDLTALMAAARTAATSLEEANRPFVRHVESELVPVLTDLARSAADLLGLHTPRNHAQA